MTIKALVATLLLLTGMTLAQTVTVTGTVDDPNGAPYSNGNGVATLVSGNGSGSQSWTTGGTNPVNPTRPISGFDSFGKFSIDLTNTAAIDQQSAQPVWVFNLCSNVNTVPSQLCFKLPGLALTVSQDITTQINAVPPPALPGSGGSCGPNCYPWINAGHFTGSDIGARVNAASATCVPNQPCHITIPMLGQQTFTTTITYVPNMTLECSPAGAAAEQAGSATPTLLKYTGSGTAIDFNGTPQGVLRNCSLDMSASTGSAIGVKETGASPIVENNYFIGGPVGTKVVNIGLSDGAQFKGNSAFEFLGDFFYVDHALDYHVENNIGYGARLGGGLSNTTSRCIVIDSGSSGGHFDTFDCGSAGLHGVTIQNTLSGLVPPTYLFINGVVSDCSYGDSWLFDSSLSNNALIIKVTNSWAAGAGQNCDGTATIRSTAYGVHISGGQSIKFSNSDIRANAYSGALVDNGLVQDVTFENNSIYGNNVANDSASNGITVTTFINGFKAVGNTITNNYQSLPNGHQRYAIAFTGNGENVNVTGNNLGGNVTGPILYPNSFGFNVLGNTNDNTPMDSVFSGNIGAYGVAAHGQGGWLIPQFGSVAGLIFGLGINMYFDGTNFHMNTDASNNGGCGWLGSEDGSVGLYCVPTNGTPASDQTISAAALSSYKQLTVSPITGLASKSYNTVLQADQYCTTPGTLDQTCLANAASALPGSGGAIHMRSGTYTFSSLVTISIPSGVCYTLFGDGQDVTVVSAATTDAIAFNYGNSQSCVTISDLTVATGANGTSKGISLNAANANSNPALGPMSNVTRVGFRGSDGWTATHYWATALNMVNVSNVNVESINISGSASALGTGISFAGNSSLPSYAVVLNISKSNINWLSHGFVYGSYVQGVTIDQSNFTADTTAIAVPFGETGSLDQFNIFDNQFGAGSAGQTSLIFGTAVGSVNVHNNLMFVGSSGNAINYIGGNATFIGNQIFCTSNSGSTGVALASISAPLTFSGNQVGGCQAGIAIDSTDAFMSITGNNLYSNTAAISGTSTATTNFISDNPGYNPVGVSSPTPSASPWTYANGPSPAACYARATTGISQISVGGVNTLSTALGAGVMGSINLGPNEAAIITYTGTATLVCSVH